MEFPTVEAKFYQCSEWLQVDVAITSFALYVVNLKFKQDQSIIYSFVPCGHGVVGGQLYHTVASYG